MKLSSSGEKSIRWIQCLVLCVRLAVSWAPCSDVRLVDKRFGDYVISVPSCGLPVPIKICWEVVRSGEVRQSSRGPWSLSEAEKLVRLHQEERLSFSEISRPLPGRTRIAYSERSRKASRSGETTHVALDTHQTI